MDKEWMKRELDMAVSMLSAILLSGDAVDMMASAKAKIRKVAASLTEGDGNNGG